MIIDDKYYKILNGESASMQMVRTTVFCG